ncbi:UNVERIFIED_CONTAM: hypothetical protein HDU68_011096 [Siphonaria sp. JEL0065]|nr:hypothetical protein HDU68_011096 [Siphonaria sp. JEL0065]
MKLIKTLVFIQDGKNLQDAACIVEAGNTLKGHIYLSLAGTVRNLKLDMKLLGKWKCTWRPRVATFHPETGEALTPVIEGNMEAGKTVTAVSQDVYEGTLLRGEHGLPANISVPVSAPPSLATPTRTGTVGTLCSPVPMHANCSYSLIMTASCSTLEGGSEEKTFVIPVSVMAPSGLRAAVLRNQPRPLNFSNAGRLAVPSTISSDAAKVSPFSYPRMDPLDPILRVLDPPAEVRPLVDKDLILYELDVPRLHHYIGDQVSFTMAIKPKPPLYIHTKVYSITASLITHIHFQLPSKLPNYQRPPSAAIAVRLHTETWNNKNAFISDLFDPMNTQPRRFHFTIPETLPCPSLPDTAQNKLPIEILHILRISVRLSDLSSVPEHLDQLQPLSAVKVHYLDALVLDIPIVLVAKGNQIYSWGLPRVPRGWRVGQMVAAIAESMGADGKSEAVGDNKEEKGIIVKATAYGEDSAYSPSASSPKQPKRRASGFLSSVFGGAKPGPQQHKHPKFTAEELNKMAQDAMKAGIDAEKQAAVLPAETEVTSVIVPDAGTDQVKEEDLEEKIEDQVVVETSTLTVVDAPTGRWPSIITIPVENASPEVMLDPTSLTSPQWEVENKPLEVQSDNDNEISEEDDPACVSAQPTTTTKKPHPIPVVAQPPPAQEEEFHSQDAILKPITQDPKKEDQMKKELEHGLDELGRFLPLTEFSGRYRVIYPYLEGLRRDEIKLSIGDLVDV